MCHSKNKTKFVNFLKENNILQYNEVFITKTSEDVFMTSLGKILTHMNLSLERQKIDNNYRFDGYIPELDVVIEYDENCHMHYNVEKEDEREKYIRNNYTLVIRVNDFNELADNIGVVVSKIVNLFYKN